MSQVWLFEGSVAVALVKIITCFTYDPTEKFHFVHVCAVNSRPPFLSLEACVGGYICDILFGHAATIMKA